MTKKEKPKSAENKTVLGETYEPGVPQDTLDWRKKFANRDQMLTYLKTGERYWFSKDWFGSEKRKKPA